VHANVVYLLRLSDGALVPIAPEMRSVNRVQVIGDSLLVHTDLDAPRGRLCIAPLTAPTEWRTLIPESSDTLQTVTGVGGRLYAVYAQAASHRVRVHAEDGTYLRELALPAVGSVNHTWGVSGVSARGAATTCGWISRRTCSRSRCIGTTTRRTA
jgi:prolyl oligopeptidase